MTEPSTSNARQNVTFPSNGSQAHGYLATPPSGSGPGVIVIQEWWGLTDHIADVSKRLAAEGFVALAPDLFGGKVAHDADEAMKLLTELPVDRAARDLSGAVDYLLAQDSVTSSTVGAIGFCMGGGFVLMLAAQQGERISAAVPFYGVGPGVPSTYTGVKAAVQGHYAEQDGMYPPDQARALEKQIRDEAGVLVEFFYYDAGHAFHNDENLMGSYDEKNAKLAWSRAIAFLKENVT
ncbi:MAG: carboxymethylenebutenolidase [Actinomycetota bacterium]|jgi:carboxymethylenebutenolidase|nr:carboxymethylenebutenolidase [Actinomycetota bacterium]